MFVFIWFCLQNLKNLSIRDNPNAEKCNPYTYSTYI